jgi:hypothetical protein
VAGLIGVWSD